MDSGLRNRHDPRMVWVFWGAVALLLVGLGVLSWWWDHDVRKRGATPLSGGAMQRARWSRNLELERQMNSVIPKGATPRMQEAAHDAWKGTTDR
jgi:hypothetical protein